MTEKIKCTIDGKALTVEPGTTILQATQLLGIEVPLFCYHPRLSIAGNCRMCLVEVEGKSSPVASCATPVTDGVAIKTTTQFVRDSRQGALEFLLLHHPLDCPICDQGGECDLQDITVSYGCDATRYKFAKRAVPQKDFGPLIKTEMNRCIHCTRCVRFATEVAGEPHLGAVNRGEKTEIVSLLGRPFASELSGNVIDLCPVGALTSRPYAFKGRPWELTKVETIDVMDAVGSHIRVDAKGLEVMRILPRVFEPINEEWISDKTRFACDGLKKSRLDRAYVKNSEGVLKEATFEAALKVVADKLKACQSFEVAGLVGDMVDTESMFVFKQLMSKLNVPHVDCRQDGVTQSLKPRCSYIMNTPIAALEEVDFALFVGTNPRIEAPLINARLRKAYAHGNLEVGTLGPFVDLSYPSTHYGDDPALLEAIHSGKHPAAKKLEAAKKPILIIGQAALRRKDSGRLLALCHQIADKYGLLRKDWCGFNVLQLAASRVGGLDLGLVPSKGGKSTEDILNAASLGTLKVVYLLGADEIDTSCLKDTFVIYQGHHGDQGAAVADVILPAAAYTEKDGLYVNAEGRPQYAHRACPAPGDALEDWKILAHILRQIDADAAFNTLHDVREALFKAYPHLAKVGSLVKKPFEPFLDQITMTDKFSDGALKPAIENFYQTNVISRYSETMAQCAKTFFKKNESTL